MSTLSKIIYGAIAIIIGVYVTTMIMGFLGVEVGTYGNYLAWLVALVLFYAILPARVGDVFQ